VRSYIMEHLHKKFTNSQVKALITRYLKKEIGRKYIQEILGIKKTRFFALIKRFKDNPENFPPFHTFVVHLLEQSLKPLKQIL